MLEPAEDEEPPDDGTGPPPADVSCEDTVPFISFDFTISCFASLLLVPGFVRLIFILRPLSTVAECSTAILPGFPGLPCAAFTPLATAFICLPPVPGTIDAEPFALPAPFPLIPPMPLTMLPFPLPGLLDRPDEFRPQEDADDTEVGNEEDEDADEEDDADDDDEEEDEEDEDDDEEDCPQPFGPADATTDEDSPEEVKPFEEL